ncbi:protein ALTERED PHOSPHATE STARVATION RESPONSE 1-like [Wolffia australiana]
MGCAYSKVEREEAVRRCRDRRKLVKRLMAGRAQFAAAHLAYLRALRNAGATIRQLAEADACPPPLIRPPLSPSFLPPPPPPLPPFSPDEEPKGEDAKNLEQTTMESDQDSLEEDPVELKEDDLSMLRSLGSRSLAEVARDIDEYFLKASAGGTKVAQLLESHLFCSLQQLFNEGQGKKLKRWSLKVPLGGANAKKLGHHSSTLDKLLADELKLFKEVKDEEMKKLEFGKKVALLRCQETRKENWMVTDRTRSSMELVQIEIVSLQESITSTCTSISTHRDEELFPQLVELCSGLAEMWRTMYECHVAQNSLAPQISHLHGPSLTEPTTEAHIAAAAQLKDELGTWLSSLHSLLRCQKDYALCLNKWLRLTDCLPPAPGPLSIFRLCDQWQLSLDQLSHKGAAEAMERLVGKVRAVEKQLGREQQQRRRTRQVEKRLGGEDADGNGADGSAGLGERRRQAEEEKGKYMGSIRQSRSMINDVFKVGLPDVFQAMMGFANGCACTYEGVQLIDG